MFIVHSTILLWEKENKRETNKLADMIKVYKRFNNDVARIPMAEIFVYIATSGPFY